MSNTSQKKTSTLTADRYKLVFPLQVQRDALTKSEDSNVDEVDGVQSSFQTDPANVSSRLTKQRAVLPDISNDNVKIQVDMVKQYLQELNIPMTIKSFTTELLQNNILPYNPYPGYIKRFRRVAERFYTERRALSELRKKLDTPVAGLEGTYLSKVKHSQYTVFGLQHIVSHVHSETIQSYQPLLTATVTSETASDATGQKISIMRSVCGPGVFSNSFYGELPCIDIRVSILISSPNIKEASRVFAKVVMEDTKAVLHHKLQQLLELQVDVFSRGGWVVGKWSHSALNSMFLYDDGSRSSVEGAIAEAIEGNRKVSLKLMTFNADKLIGNYVFTTKYYDLLFLRTQAGPAGTTSNLPTRGQSQLSVSSLPYLALLEGVFLDLSEVKLYVSTFEKFYTFPNGKKASKAYPLNPDVLNPILQVWENKIASSVLEHSAFSTIHYMLVVHLARNKTSSFAKHTERDFAIQVCRFHDGTAVRLQRALFLTQALSNLASSIGEIDNVTSEVLPRLQILLNDIVQECFCSTSPEKQILEDLLDAVFRSSLSGGSVNKNSLRNLKCRFYLATLAANEDVLERSSAILSFREKINSKNPAVVSSLADIPTQAKGQHGVKNAAWINVDISKVDMNKSIADSQAPKSVSSSASMMQYCLDIRIDEIWEEFMKVLLLISNHLPPNPFPHLIVVMRKGSMSVQSFFETDGAVADRVLQRKRLPVQGMNEVVNVPGTTAYGYRSSLVLLNTTGFRQYSSLANSVFISNPGETTSGYPLQLGPFRANVCSGFVDICPYYGSLTPFLTSVDIDEHFFIIALQSDSRSPLSLLAEKLLASLVELKSKGAVLHQAKFGQVQLDLFTLVNSAARFDSEFTTAVEGNHFVVFSFYFSLTWRYILVTKRILVYFSEQGGNRMTRTFPHSSYTEKRSSTVFLHPIDANYCLRPGRILPFAVTSFIKSTWPSREWTRLIKSLAAHAQVLLSSAGTDSKSSFSSGKSMSNDDLAKLLTGFCYRYNNGLPGQIDYLLSMNSTLENLVSRAISVLSENTDLSTVLRLSLVDAMMEEYMVKTKEVMSQPSALLPASFADFLLLKFKTVAPRNPNSNAIHMRYNKTSLETLHEVEGYLTCVRNSLAEDLLLASPLVVEFIVNQLRHS